MNFTGAKLFDKGRAAYFMLLLAICYTSALQAEQTSPQRIITLSPHLAELVYLLGAGDRLRGVSEGSNYPADVHKIPHVGGAAGLDMERILSLRPDLVLAWQGGTRQTDIHRLKELDLPVVSIEGEKMDDIPGSLQILGELLNRQQQASLQIEAFNRQIKHISEKYQHLPTRRIFIEISSQPLMGLTNRHPFGAGLELCGLENILSGLDKAAIVVDLESILSRNVEYVLLREGVAQNDLVDRKIFYQVNENVGLMGGECL